jgi:hypothetical protein
MVRALSLLAALTLACTAPNPDWQRGSSDGSVETAPPKPDRPQDPPAEVPDAPVEAPVDTATMDLVAPDAGPAALGQPCSNGAGCASGTCVHGVCCNDDCRGRCWSCTLQSALGTCTLVPADEDPHDDCPAEAPATCGRSGACDGAGSCKAGATRACPLAECTGDACAVECSGTVPCATGSQCIAGRCVGNGPVLHWRFDETSGAQAADATGNGFSGTYQGEPTAPTPSTNVPTTMFSNPRSRTFAASGRPGVFLANPDNRIQSSNAFSISLWFRTTSVPSNGGSVFSINLDVMMRVTTDGFEFDKRKSTVEGQIYAIARARDLPAVLDGRWHHVAGVLSSKGMDVYYDGSPRKHDVDGQPALFAPTGALWVGREATTGHDFRGDIDDVRVYDRALTQAEITALAGGNP